MRIDLPAQKQIFLTRRLGFEKYHAPPNSAGTGPLWSVPQPMASSLKVEKLQNSPTTPPKCRYNPPFPRPTPPICLPRITKRRIYGKAPAVPPGRNGCLNYVSLHVQRMITSLEAVYYFWGSWGPAATRALPAALFSYFLKFLMKREARSSALVYQVAASA